MIQVGRYTRTLGASLERLFENALDWEHLPHLHRGSFTAIEIVEADAGGWRAKAFLAHGRPIDLELRLDRAAGRWITESRAESVLLSRIVTDAKAIGEERCSVDVAFFAPDMPDAEQAAAGRHYEALYASLYDEDEAMMIARAEALRAGATARRERRRVALADGSLHDVPRVCPHQGLPLDAEPDAAGVLTCPWHGYRFDVQTGRCLSGQIRGWKRLGRSRQPCLASRLP